MFRAVARRQWGYRLDVSEQRHAGETILIFDGACGFCQRSVRFVLANESRTRREAGDRLLFAPLGGETCGRVLGGLPMPEGVILVRGGRVLTRSDAAGEVLRLMGGVWSLVGAVVLAVPRGLREWAYGLIASRRRGLMRPMNGGVACAVPDASQRARLLA